MDPDTALASIVNAAVAGDADSVEILAEGLVEWLRRGGFPPRRSRIPQLVSLTDGGEDDA